MGQMKVVHEASQVAFNAGAALQTNVQVSHFPTDHISRPITHWGVTVLKLYEPI